MYMHVQLACSQWQPHLGNHAHPIVDDLIHDPLEGCVWLKSINYQALPLISVIAEPRKAWFEKYTIDRAWSGKDAAVLYTTKIFTVDFEGGGALLPLVAPWSAYGAIKQIAPWSAFVHHTALLCELRCKGLPYGYRKLNQDAQYSIV